MPPILRALGNCLGFQGRLAEAASVLGEAIEAMERSPEPDADELCDSLNLLGNAYLLQGAYDEAERTLMKGLAACNPKSLERPWLLGSLAELHIALGDYAKAQVELDACLDEVTAKFGDKHSAVAAHKEILARLRVEQGSYEEAEEILNESLQILRECDFDPCSMGLTLLGLAQVYLASGRTEMAAEETREALKVLETVPGNPPERISALETLARVALVEKDWNQAGKLLDAALSAASQTYGGDHPGLASILMCCGRLSLAQNRYDEAERHLQDALKIVESKLRSDHPRAGEILLELATLRERQGRVAEAEELRARGRAIRQKAGCIN